MNEETARRTYDADEVDAYTRPLEERIAALRSRLDAPPRRTGSVATQEPWGSDDLFIDRALRMAQWTADQTLQSARGEASVAVARANEEAADRLADARVRAALLVTTVQGRVDSLAVGWEHQLLKQISDTRYGMLSDLERYAEQLECSPNQVFAPLAPDWPSPIEPFGPLSQEDVEDLSTSVRGLDDLDHEGTRVIERELAVVSTAAPESSSPDVDDSPTTEPTPPIVVPTRRRRRFGLFARLNIIRWWRSRASRKQVTSGDDPFFNPDLRWEGNCGDDEFLTFLRHGNPNVHQSITSRSTPSLISEPPTS